VSLPLEESFVVSVDLAPAIEIGITARGLRRIIPITGGIVTGPRITGRVLAGGADYQVVRSDGVTELDARYVLETDDGDRVYVQNEGFRVASPEDVASLLRGEAVDPARVYFRTTPRFEAAAPALQWLTHTIMLCVGERHPESVHLTFYAVG
jgi:hypothetical protein